MSLSLAVRVDFDFIPVLHTFHISCSPNQILDGFLTSKGKETGTGDSAVPPRIINKQHHHCGCAKRAKYNKAIAAHIIIH